MAVDAPDRGSKIFRLKYRLAKGWIILIAICGLLLTTWWWLFREKFTAVVKLPDGKRFKILKTTLGKDHAYTETHPGLTSAEMWANGWLSRIGRQISPSYSFPPMFFTVAPTICFWNSFAWQNDETESTPHWIVLTDDRGWRTAGDLSLPYGQHGPVFMTSGQSAEPRSCALAMPSSCKVLKVELLNSNGAKLGATQISYAVPNDQFRSRTLRPLPMTEKAGSISVTLIDVLTVVSNPDEAYPRFGDALTVQPEYLVTIDGTPSEGWIPLVGGVPFYESLAGSRPAASSVESPLGVVAPLVHCTVSPFESSWRIHLNLICKNPDQATCAQVVQLPALSIDGCIDANTPSPSVVSDGDAKVTLIGAGRAGSYLYEGTGEANFPAWQPIPLEILTRGQLFGTFQSASVDRQDGTPFGLNSSGHQDQRPPQFPVTVNLNLTASRPHLVISVTNAGDRYPYVVVKDQNGQELEGELFNAQGLLIWLAKLPYADVDIVDAMVLLQTPRYFSFDVVPPVVPPRSPSEPTDTK